MREVVEKTHKYFVSLWYDEHVTTTATATTTTNTTTTTTTHGGGGGSSSSSSSAIYLCCNITEKCALSSIAVCLQQRCKNLPEMQEPPQNSRSQNGEAVSILRTKNVRHHH